MKYYELKSVGCHIDKDGYTYPTLRDGSPDLEDPCHIDDITNDEWYDSLSQKDRDVIESLRGNFLSFLDREV